MGRVTEKAVSFRNRRHERRRKVEYLLAEKEQEIIREPIDEKTMISLLESLEKGSACQFGLLKLSGLVVDTIFPAPSQYLSFPFHYTTLCELAAWRGKDAIVGNLLRAGADPSIAYKRGVNKSNFHDQANYHELHGDHGETATTTLDRNVQLVLNEVELVLSKKSLAPLSRWAKQAILKIDSEEAVETLNTLKSIVNENRNCQKQPVAGFSASLVLLNLINEQSYKSHSIHESNCGIMSKQQRDILSRLQPPYQVWIVNKVVSMRVEGSNAPLQNVSSLLAADSSLSSSSSLLCSACAVEHDSMLRWSGSCGHYVCETCVWSFLDRPNQERQDKNILSHITLHDTNDSKNSEAASVAAMAETKAFVNERDTDNESDESDSESDALTTACEYRLRCPCCSILCSDDQDEVDTSAEFTSTDMAELKQLSLDKFHNLPETVDQLTSKMKAKERGKFRALNFNKVAGSFIGSVQTVRTAAFIRAVESGNVARQRAIFKAGVDLDARNEYGQTSAHVAAFFDHAPSLHFLASHGANLSLRANDGSDVLTLVARRKNAACIAVIQLHLKQHPVISLEQFQHLIGLGLKQQIKFQQPCKNMSSTILIPFGADHEGAGSRIIDGAFSDEFLEKLCSLWHGENTMPVAPPEKASCNERAYFCDAEEWVVDFLFKVLKASNAEVGASSPTKAMPHIRFVNYPQSGGYLSPHIDLSRCHHQQPKLRSTHTFLLYLTDCEEGGETALLEHLPSIESMSPAIASVKPKRGRLLLFPHNCPHEGCLVVDTPKLFLRGEFY